MKRSGSWLVTYALEQMGIHHVFGIPGVHTTELFDALADSPTITPVLTTHELGAAFMADAISRTSDTLGTIAVVPAAGLTHAMSGIGEAFLDGIPMLVISGGIRRDSGRHYQLHDLDLQALMRPVTKRCHLVSTHSAIVPTLYAAYLEAISGEPGPVFIEIPANVLMFRGEVGELPQFARRVAHPPVDLDAIKAAADLLRSARRPGLYLGWGAVDATPQAIAVAERLGAPVATTLQGLSAFPANHPLHVGMGFGSAAVPAAERAFSGCDVLLAVGVRFAELATGSYSMPVPNRLIHVDINPTVFNRNYPATVTLHGDAGDVLAALAAELGGDAAVRNDLPAVIQREKARYRETWQRPSGNPGVNPYAVLNGLRRLLPDEAIVVTDDGNHTFLTAELFEVRKARRFISPSDFNSMGYCVPATIGAKLANPDLPVVGIVGDGALLMTGLELLTATRQKLGLVMFVFHDGELAQISQFQETPFNRKTCSVLGDFKVEGIAMATGAAYLSLKEDGAVEQTLAEALRLAGTGCPVLVDVAIDYSRKTRFTQGVLKANLARLPLGEKTRMISRAVMRRLDPPE